MAVTMVVIHYSIHSMIVPLYGPLVIRIVLPSNWLSLPPRPLPRPLPPPPRTPPAPPPPPPGPNSNSGIHQHNI